MQQQRDDMHGGVLLWQGEGTLCKHRRWQSSQEPSKGFARSGLERLWNGNQQRVRELPRNGMESQRETQQCYGIAQARRAMA